MVNSNETSQVVLSLNKFQKQLTLNNEKIRCDHERQVCVRVLYIVSSCTEAASNQQVELVPMDLALLLLVRLSNKYTYAWLYPFIRFLLSLWECVMTSLWLGSVRVIKSPELKHESGRCFVAAHSIWPVLNTWCNAQLLIRDPWKIPPPFTHFIPFYSSLLIWFLLLFYFIFLKFFFYFLRSSFQIDSGFLGMAYPRFLFAWNDNDVTGSGSILTAFTWSFEMSRFRGNWDGFNYGGNLREFVRFIWQHFKGLFYDAIRRFFRFL